MFEPQKDRVDYGKLLTPPDGFELDFAVGTTYSLDFDAFIRSEEHTSELQSQR